MENKTRNIIASILFFVVIIVMIIAGYYYIKKLDVPPKKENEKTKEEEKIEDFRINEEEDYVYFKNEEIISVDPELTYKDVYLNIQGAEIINSALKAENDILRDSIVKLNENNIDEAKTLLYEGTEIYSAQERNYMVYKSNYYHSLIINDLDFNCYSDFQTSSLKGYIIDAKNGDIVTNDEIIKKYNLSLEDVKDRIRSRIDETQNEIDGKEVIKKIETIDTLFDNYALYIDNNDLYISYIVKTNFVNYNDNVKLN